MASTAWTRRAGGGRCVLIARAAEASGFEAACDAALGTPRQVEYLAVHLEAEWASREASKRVSLLSRCALPAPKTFGGYDWSAVSWPDGLGREDLLSLAFLDKREDWS